MKRFAQDLKATLWQRWDKNPGLSGCKVHVMGGDCLGKLEAPHFLNLRGKRQKHTRVVTRFGAVSLVQNCICITNLDSLIGTAPEGQEANGRYAFQKGTEVSLGKEQKSPEPFLFL